MLIEARKFQEERKQVKADGTALRKDELCGDMNAMKEAKSLQSRKESSDGVLRDKLCLFATPSTKGRRGNSFLLSEEALILKRRV